ncbi:MAG: LptE family protein [Phycisphaerales bacterium]|nr:LptE family protein [Phycisphaerales bacterium]
MRLLPKLHRWLPKIFFLSASCLIANGCAQDPTQGYSINSSTYTTNINTIAVPIFTNDTYMRNISFWITDAVIKEIEARTPYKVASQATADSLLEGTVAGVELRTISKSRETGLNQEVLVVVQIDFSWRDLRSGEPMMERTGFSADAVFTPSGTTNQKPGEPLELGEFAVVQQIAEDIVDEMRNDW